MFANAFKIAVAVAALSGYVSATTYANFYDDQGCSVNGGIAVSTDNPGCLTEHGRGSVGFHGDNVQSVNLVSSPDDNCSCQNNCYPTVVNDLDPNNPCLALTGPTANSYRFVGSDSPCAPNQC